jgi:hypothetical protein
MITDRLQTQNSEINKNLIMTHPAWQDKPDLIGQYGCLLVAKCNAFNMYKKNSALLTVRNLNKLVIDRKGYNYLYINEWIYSNKIKATVINTKREKEVIDASALALIIDDYKKYFNLVVNIPKINISKTKEQYLNVQLQTLIFTDNEYEHRDPVDDIPEELIF